MKTKVAVGCGARFYGPDWLHVDGEALKEGYDHVESDEVHLRYHPSNSLDLIYASHLINYFTRDEFSRMLEFWFDRLKSGGTLRIATPDMCVMMCLYQMYRVQLKDIIGPIHGVMSLNMGQISHLTSWDEVELTELLSRKGFVGIERYDWRLTEHSHVDDHSQAYLSPKGDKENGTLISLNIQCKKP